MTPTGPAPTGLPVEDIVDDVRQALADRGRAVLVAEPGAGKTTVVPLRLLDTAWLGVGRIVVLEPRRLAARASARRMADLLGEPVGATVGYRTRDDRRVSAATRIEVVTEGILTRRLQHDPGLEGVGLVVFDEFHERSLQADLGLALTLDVARSLRPELRILVMSATLDAERVATLLGAPEPAPVIASTGRTHPVDVRYRSRGRADRLEPFVAAEVLRLLDRESGDVLVFLPGAAAIERVFEQLTGSVPAGVDVRRLYGALPTDEQDAALAPASQGRRRVVLSTDIAETSLTVEGVRLVVDAGLARSPRFDPRTGMTRLETGPASRASAEQRAGRAGRIEPGVAVRLWSRGEQGARRRFTPPEMGQVDLAGLALELAAWGADDASELPFLDPPPAAALAEGRSLLTMLGALDDRGRITDAGRRMVELPVHPRLARMILGSLQGLTAWTACLLAGLLAERDVLRGRPDEVPTDVALRLELLADRSRRHPALDVGALRRVRTAAHDLARRVGVEPGDVDPLAAGSLLVLAYPDRLARARPGRRSRYVLRSGGGAWLADTDVLAAEELLVVAELDGDRREARIRLAAPVDPLELELGFGEQVTEVSGLRWDDERDELVVRVERRLDGLVLSVHEGRPAPGEATTAALVERVRETGLGLLGWSRRARELQARLGFVREHRGEPWPLVDDAALRSGLDEWLPAFLGGATGRADLERVDMAAVLSSRLGHAERLELDRLAPGELVLASGRRVRLDYSDGPRVAARAQDLYGTTVHPTVLDGAVPVTVEVLSPADRPVQVTADLPGFWAGSWADVRKDMAGRYPKHHWPVDPTQPA